MRNINKIRQILGFSVILAITGLALLLYWGMRGGEGKKPQTDALPVGIDLSLKKVRYAETRDGVTRWVLEAEKADMSRSSDTVFLTRPRLVTSPDRSGRSFTIQGERAEYLVKAKEVLLEGNVIGTGTPGIRFATPRARYSSERGTVTSSDTVSFSYRGTTVDGVGMEAFVESGRVHLLSKVSAVVRKGGT